MPRPLTFLKWLAKSYYVENKMINAIIVKNIPSIFVYHWRTTEPLKPTSIRCYGGKEIA